MSSTTETTLNMYSPSEKSSESIPDQEKIQLVEFDGADDPFDPKNYSTFKKWVILLAVTHGAVVVTCASSLYVR
jgi:hypothetical protein